jgi:hypothetical protein
MERRDRMLGGAGNEGMTVLATGQDARRFPRSGAVDATVVTDGCVDIVITKWNIDRNAALTGRDIHL